MEGQLTVDCRYRSHLRLGTNLLHLLGDRADVHERGASRRVLVRLPLGDPLAHSTRRVLRGEVSGEETTHEEGLLQNKRVVWEERSGCREVLIGDLCGAVLHEAVDPRVSDAVRELLLLAPEDLGGQQWVLLDIEGLAHEVLLNQSTTVLLGSLVLGCDAHGDIQEGLVEEGNAHLDGVRHARLVGAQAVRGVQMQYAIDRLLEELLVGGRVVEVEVAAEDLVGTLARKNNLDAHLPDVLRQQVHRSGGADRRHIVRLQMPHQLVDHRQSVLITEVDLVVLGADEVGHLARRHDIGAVRIHADGEGVHGETQLLHLTSGDRTDQARVESSREEQSDGRVAHQPLRRGAYERLADEREIRSGRAQTMIEPQWLQEGYGRLR
ncbi:hypothetical protein PMAYCL1PPCAC_25376 [Pristionchus mayeri]|uniref:Uncharacterized protein n=1 Tax=Pristionchus mayeri TaxID=1317129 RepID=A0AAN5D2K2_9BILA|nr:hypothetical protein PMAYCL1PPCAC_25376 [Pristionchus mayeri]